MNRNGHRNRRLVTLVASVACTACAAGPTPAPVAPPSLQAPPPRPPVQPVADPAVDDPLRAAPPTTSDDWQPRGDAAQSFTLPNGMRVVLVERHGLPYVTARLAVDAPSPPSDPEADLRRALVSEVFLRSSDGVGQPTRWSAANEYGVLARGASSELGEILEREAAVVRATPAEPEAERRLSMASRFYDTSSGNVSANAQRSTSALLFGYDHPYAVPAVAPAPLSMAELRRWRQAAFVPGATTLVLVGDVALAQAKALVARSFGDWRGRAGPGARRAPLPPLPDDKRILFTENRYMPVDFATVVLRGPAWGDPDVAAVLVATSIYQAPLPRSAPCQEMENELPTSRQAVPLAFLPGVSVVTLGGSFAPKTAVAAIGGVLGAIRGSREADAPAEALARAKRMALAAWRRHEEDWASLTFTVSSALVAGSPESAFGLEERIASVTAADVRRVAQRYFADDALRVVLIGRGPHFSELQDLGLGGAKVVDSFARPRSRTTK